MKLPQPEDLALHPTVRNSLLTGMGAGFVAFFIASVIEWQGAGRTLYDLITYPTFAAAMVVMWLCIFFVPSSLRVIVTLMTLGLIAFFGSKLTYLFFSASTDTLTELAETAFWVPGIYVISFIIPGMILARRAAMGFALYTAVLGLLYVALTAGEPWYGLRHIVLQIALANLGFAIMTHGFTATKDSLAQAQSEAAALHILSRTDPLTKLPNRLGCVERLHDAVANCDSFGVVFIDLDRFKAVNDTYGHDAGDALLVAVSERLRSRVRPGDTLARISGDEFVLLVRDVDSQAEALAVIDTVRGAFADLFTLGGVHVEASASMGYCLYPEHGDDADTLLRRADQAMYRVKSSGRDGVSGFDNAPLPSAEQAARAGQLSLHYQPIYDLNGRLPVAVEAFLRWDHPERGFLEGQAALALLEHDDGAEAFILGAACRQLTHWQRRGYVVSAVSVNISAPMFARANFFGTVTRSLAAAGLDPHYLILELNEHAFNDEVHTQNTLHRLRTLGVRIALGNFGAGTSSLHVLSHVAVDLVKLDRKVVAVLTSLLNNPHEALAKIRATLAAAEVLEIPVIAEGVETDEQARRMREMGIDAAQGFYFSPPLSVSELEAVLPTEAKHSEQAATN